MIYVGVDPGLTGGVALLSDDGSATSYEMPTFAYSPTGTVKRAVNCYELARLLRASALSGGVSLYIERVNAFPGQGVSSMFSLGMSYWGAVGAAAGLGIPVELVGPQEWKKHYRLRADKADALELARSLYPGVNLSKKKDHGRAEALLIAHYGMQKARAE